MRDTISTRKRQILALLICYGYFKYFVGSPAGYYDDQEVEVKSSRRHLDEGVTLPPHLKNNELFNLANPTDSSGREIFADRRYRPIVVEGKSVNYSALSEYQLKKSHSCDVRSLWPDPTTKPKCTVALLREFYKKCDFFVDMGDWRDQVRGFPTAQFHPDLCDLPKADSLEENMIKALNHGKAQRILILGDSNSHKFYLNLLQLLYNVTKLDYKCETIKKEPEGKVADVSYYTNGTSFKPGQILINERTCSSCNSELNRCVLPPSSPYRGRLPAQLELEYLSMTLVTLDAITIKAGGVGQSITQQEFLLKYYLKGRYPDLMVIGATFTHDKRKKFVFVQKCLEHFIKVIDDNVPKSTRIMWFDAAAHNGIPQNHCPILFNIRIFDMDYELRGNQKLEMLNHLMFYILKDKLIDPKSNNFAMLDLYRLSELVMRGWAKDCVHFIPDWYQTMTSYMFGMLASADDVIDNS